jgi:hypothetical protein
VEAQHKGRIVGSFGFPGEMAFGAIRRAPGVDLPTKEKDYDKMSGPVKAYNLGEKKEGTADEPYRPSRKYPIIND